MKRLIVRFTAAFLLVLFSSAIFASGIDTSSSYSDIKKAIEDSIGWAIEKDFDYMFSLTANDENFFHFWTTSDSQVVGITAFKKYAERWKDPDLKGTRFEFKDLRINISRSGDVAWYSTYLDDCGQYKGKEFCENDVLLTGVLEKRDGKWVNVLIHGSFPIDKIPEDKIKYYYKNLFQDKK
jgi:ketosteroid isomerase-like protein